MPGKDKTKDQLPKLAEWKAPWEVDKDTGVDIPKEDQDIDPDKLKRYLHGLLSDKIALRANLDETTARAEELEQKIADATDPKQVETLQQELADARKERDEAKKNQGDKVEILKLEVALEKGLTKTQAKRLLGTTKDELEQDAEELLASFGGSGKPGGDSEDDEPPVRKGPRRTMTNGGDPDPDAGSDKGKKDDEDPDKVYEKWLASR